ncbi:hypothetical protein SAMN05444392_11326 [Seinonella peptonophila]|uniref:Uncharacterized protein n=1 Tax=Seinonella peptonophila TaxID=112248 RepID=A0A1M5ACQ1_9BACL|nr:hypothetical protein [Seinonella peptonophila]SHF27867.1 hypothetical protein SAMN05444392_11326 [Seinonella peptonophila]
MMKRESRLWIYFLLQLLEQLQKQAKEMPDIISISNQELAELKDELFELTIESKIDESSLSDQELYKEVTVQLLSYLNDSKRFSKKVDLQQFAEDWGIRDIKTSHSMTHIIGTILLQMKEQKRAVLENLLKYMQGESPSRSTQRHNTNEETNQETDFTWFDFFESVKK